MNLGKEVYIPQLDYSHEVLQTLYRICRGVIYVMDIRNEFEGFVSNGIIVDTENELRDIYYPITRKMTRDDYPD